MKNFKDTFPILTSCSECNHTSASASSRKQHNGVILTVFAVFSTPHTTTITTTTRSTIRHPATNPAVGVGHTMGRVGGRAGKTYLFWVLGLSHAGRNWNISHISKARDTPPVQNHHMKTFQTYTVICIKASLALVKNQPKKAKTHQDRHDPLGSRLTFWFLGVAGRHVIPKKKLQELSFCESPRRGLVNDNAQIEYNDQTLPWTFQTMLRLHERDVVRSLKPYFNQNSQNEKRNAGNNILKLI